jgi:anti-sigma B factor antagonist
MIRHSPFDVRVDLDGTTARVVPSGELDLATAPRLQEKVRSTLGTVTRVILDLSQLTFIDSSGLRLLIVLHDRAKAEGWTLSLVAPVGETWTTFRISGGDKHLPFVTHDGSGPEEGSQPFSP